jgi:predicted transcriptional regulator
MKEARKLLRAGTSAAEAARITGLTPGAISQDAECQAIRGEAEPSKVELAFRIVKATSGRTTAYAACKEVGISQSALSRYEPYKKYKGEQDAQKTERVARGLA